jgi:hypothetical protein
LSKNIIGNSALFIWPLTNGKAFVEGRGLMSIDEAVSDGHTIAGRSMLNREMTNEIEGRGCVFNAWGAAAEYGTTIDYDFDEKGYRARREESQRQKAEVLKSPKTVRQKALAARKAPHAAVAAPPTSQALSPWAAAIVESEEAILRPDAAATLLEIHSESTMSAALAVAFLSSLPIEHYSFSQPTPEDQMSTLNASAAITRAAELRMSALTVRGQNGDAAALAESKRLAAGLHNHRTMGTELGAALRASGANITAVAELAKTFA